MGYLDGLTANMYRTDSHGRSVLVPFGRWGKAYLVPPDRAEAFARFQRRYLAVTMAGILASAIAFGLVIMWAVVLPLCIAGNVAAFWHFIRGLEIAPEVPPLNRREAISRAARAMGARTLAAVCLGATTLTLLCAAFLAYGVRSLALWALTAYFALVAVLYAVRWRQLRDRNRAT
jgi:hypothetical protein